MKILMVGPYPFPNENIKGGVEAVIYNFVEGVKLTPHVEIIVLSFFKERDETIRIANNITIKYFKKRYGNMKLDLLFFAKQALYKEFNESNSDIIHIQGNGSSLLLVDKKYSDKIVITQHGIIAKERKVAKSFRAKLNYGIVEIIEKYKLRFTKNWVFISEYNKNINEKLVNNSEVKWGKIYNSVNPLFFEQTLNNPKTSFYYVGGIGERKGLVDILRCSNNLQKGISNINLYVIGGFINNNYKDLVEKELANKNSLLNTNFCGWKNSSEIIEITKNTPFFVLPSYQETLPVVIAEAMAMGKIVIATNICGIPEMVTHNETGFLYEPGDIDSLSTIIKQVITMSEQQIKDMGAKAKEKAKQLYHPKKVVEQTVEFYCEILK